MSYGLSINNLAGFLQLTSEDKVLQEATRGVNANDGGAAFAERVTVFRPYASNGNIAGARCRPGNIAYWTTGSYEYVTHSFVTPVVSGYGLALFDAAGNPTFSTHSNPLKYLGTYDVTAAATPGNTVTVNAPQAARAGNKIFFTLKYNFYYWGLTVYTVSYYTPMVTYVSETQLSVTGGWAVNNTGDAAAAPSSSGTLSGTPPYWSLQLFEA